MIIINDNNYIFIPTLLKMEFEGGGSRTEISF